MDETKEKIQFPLGIPGLTGVHYLLQRPSLIREVKKQLLEELQVQKMQENITELTELVTVLQNKIENLEEEVKHLKQGHVLHDWYNVDEEEAN